MAINTFVRLNNGAPTADQQFDPDNIPTSDETNALIGTDGSPSGANLFVTEQDTRIPSSDEDDALDGIGGFPPSGFDLLATKGYVDQEVAAVSAGLAWLDAVDHNIKYVKTDTGAPTGTPDAGDKLLNTFDNVLYSEAAAVWDAGVAATTGDRYIFKDDGVGTGVIGGATTGTSDDKVREYNGATIDEIVPIDGSTVCVLDENRKYTYNTVDWVVLESITTHSAYTGLTGGNGTDEFFHLTQAQDDGLAASAVALTASNPVLDDDSRDKATTTYSFMFLGGLGILQTVNLFEASGSEQGIEMPAAGSIIGVSAGLSGNATGSSITLRHNINGTHATPNATIAIGNDKASVTSPLGSITFAAGNTIGATALTTASWTSTTVDIMVQIHVVFDS